MNDQDESLFSREQLRREVLDVLTESKPTNVSIAYTGAALLEGRIDAIALADGLKGTGRFVNRVAELQLGSQSEFHLEVEGEPRSGSIEIFLRFYHPLIKVIDSVGDSKFLVGIATILTLTGFSAKMLESH